MPHKRPNPPNSAFKKNPRRKLLLESIEDRILCSATVDPAAAMDQNEILAAAAMAQTASTALAASAPAADPAPADSSLAPQLPAAAAQSAEIVFVDTSVSNYQALLAGMSKNVEVFLLNDQQDGLQQIAENLAGRTEIEAIHLISHGTEGSLQLGNTTLTKESMQGEHASILKTIGRALSEDGDLLVYGCNFGKGADGLMAAETLARITGADVASSTNPTGSASLGGDWILEEQTGPIAAGVAVSASAQQQWSGLLAPPPMQYFYIPLPEQAMLASMQTINGTVSGTGGMDSIITIATTENNTIIYYDQWENGYETNLSAPTQTTGTARTQIWGDGDASNGAPPGAAPGTDPAINAGTIITLRNTVPLPRNPANVFFDGGDKIGASKSISISRAEIPLPTGSVISSAVEVRDTRYFDTTYTAPVGANTPLPAGVNTMFSNDFLYVMASQDNTTVQIDADNNGVFEQTVVLNEGQNVVSTTNVLQGGRVVASKPVQADLYTGNNAASFATRSYTLLPNAQLTNDYFTPVGDSGDDVALFVYNPNAAAITVSYETRTTSGTLPAVAPGATQFFVVPADTGTRLFTAGGQPFAALGAHDTAGVGSAHDWGFSLQPTANLSQFAVVGLGVGNSSNPPSGGGINVSPVWVTPLAATTVYVDNDGNPATGLFLDPVTGSRYDQSFVLAKLQTQRVTDTTGGDQDNSGMRLFTNDGTLISTAWGEDTAAPGGSPGFDAGTTVPALPVPEFFKTVDFAPGGDANNDGYFNSGDTLRYTLRIRNIGTQPVSNSAVSDALPTSLVTYVNGSTFIDQGAGAIAISDGGITAFPLDEGGFTIANLNPGNTTTVTFDVTVNGSLPTGTSDIYNAGRLAYQIYNLPATNTASLRGTVTGTVYVDANNNGAQDVGEAGIAGVTLTLTGTDILGAAVSKTATTDGSGRYQFIDLKESNGAGYTVTQTQPPGYVDGLEARGGVVIPGSGGGPNVITTISVIPGENDTDNNFGETGGTISGSVYVDANNNGTRQGWELGITGVTVTLAGTDIAGDPVNVSVLTDASGNYAFANLRQSNGTGYTITEVTPAGYTDGLDARQGVVIGGSNATDAITPPIVLATGASSTTNTFGEIPIFNLTKSLQLTSVAGTAGPNVAIGETATFRLVASVPAGGFTDFQIQDALPVGYQYVNGSAVVSLVSSAGQLTSSTLAGAGLAQTGVGTPVFVMPDAAVSNNSTTNVDVYTTGTDVFFKLGNLTNLDTTAAIESVVIEFQAVVLNEAGNQAGTSLPNTFTALFEKDGIAGPETHGAPSNSVATTVVEPVLGVTKTLAVSGTDAGDAVQYTITITNAGANAATAYDINLADVLASTLTFGSVSATGATITSDTTAGNNVNIVLDAIAAGGSATVTINATVASTAPTGSTVGNNTTVTWTSTPGANANERNGGGGLDDYTGSATSGNFTLARPTVDKLTPSDTTYSIGETVTYDILVTLPEGVTQGLAITDNLPAGLDFVSAAVQTAAGGVLGNAFNGTVPAFVTSNVGNSYTFTFGNTTATGDNDAANNSFLVRVTARVANVVGNQNAVTLTNTATLAYNDGTLGATTVNDPTPNVNITVVEPALTLDKTVVGVSTGLDAGDTVQYQIVITNTGTATANEVTLNDALPAGLLVTTINSTTPAGGAAVDTATGGTGTANLTGEYTIPVGGSITILYTATLQSSVTPNTNFTNTATVTYSSVDGTVLGQGTANGERTGSGGLNDYVLTDTALVATGGVLAVAKGVDNATPVIGDVLTYTVTLTLNEGTTNGIVVTDTLPASGDLQFVGGSGAITFGTPGSSISGSVLPAISGANSNVLTFTLGDAVIPAGAGANTVVLTYQVLVTNVITNQAGDVETNSAGVVATGLVSPPPATTSVTLREPTLTFSKTATTGGPVSAGDPVTYTLTFTNPAGANAADAFDALVLDTMPADILVTSIDSTVLAGGATADSAAVITGGGTGLSGQFDVPIGGSVTITYTGTLQITAAAGTAETNNAELTWTSVNGGNSLTPDANERYGAPGTLLGDGSVNDYRRIGTQTITVATASFDKQLFSTSDAATTGSDVGIGENVTYALVVSLPAGTVPSLSIADTLPAGLQYVPGSVAVVTTAAGSNGLLTADFNGTVPAPTVTGGASDGDDVNIDFGAITAASDGNPANNRFLVLLTARVTDIPANEGILPGQTSLPNTATFDIPGDGLPPSTPPSVDVTVVEPVLTIDKEFNVTQADAGDTVQVSLVVGNTGTGPVHDVSVTDVVDLTKFGSIAAVTTPAGFVFNNAAGTVTYTGGTIAAGASATFVFSVKLNDGVNPSEVLSNTSSATGSSQPGVVAGERSFGPVQDTDTITVPPVFTLAKGITSPGGGTVQLGDVVTYQVTVTLVEGTTQNISLSDTLPAGMTYVPGSAVVSNANGMTVNGFAAGIAGQVLTMSATSVVNPGNVDNAAATDSDSFTITYQAVVNEVPGNVAGTLLTNNLTGSGTGVPPSTPPPATTTVTEPRLKVTKAADDSTPDLGQTVHFTLTIQNLAVPNGATAFDILVRDALPAGLAGLSNITVTGAAIDTNGSTGTALDLKLDQLALGATATVEFDAVVGTAAALTGASIDNNARVYWDSQAAESPNAVLTGSADGDEDRDYGATGADEAFNLDPQDAQDTERLVVNGNTISGVVYQDADASGTLNGAEAGVGTGVQVTISGNTFFGEAFTQTVTANAVSGIYTFTDVPRSDATGYTITETQPVAFVDGIETAGTLGGATNNALGADAITTVVVPAGSSTGTGYNFGELLGSGISGFTYLDLNNDGTKQPGETGLVTALPVTLIGTDVFGQAVSLAGASNAVSGAFAFTGLRPSNGAGYTVAENDAAVVPVTFYDGKDTAGSLGGTVTGGGPKFDAINVNVAQNQNGTGYNFGEINKSSLSGAVYADLNNNGSFDAFERGVPGMTITLTGTDDQGTPVSITVTTNAGGAYSFANIRPSNGAGYTISETQPADYADGADTIGTPGGNATVNDVFSAVVLAAGTSGTNNNFGEQPNFTLTKSLASTSEAGTPGNSVAIGEVATFRLVVTVPAGSLTDFQVRDLLPAGYEYLDGSARAGLVGALTSSTITAPLAGIGSTPAVALPDGAVSSLVGSDDDTYASGTDVFFKFGDITNTDTTAAVEAIVIEFDARVVNETANTAGTVLSNNFSVLYDADGTGDPDPNPTPSTTVNTTVISPVLTFAKTASTAGPVNAGDVITYTLTIANPGGANSSTAFDALVTDTMPADIRITNITGTVLAGGATTDSAVAITGGGAGLSGQFDIPALGSVTITYQGTVQVTAAPGTAQINNAGLTWTSINGSNSLTPDGGERFGAPGTLFGDLNLNNLRRTDSQTVTVATANFEKQLFSTSDTATAGSDVAIGENVTYALVVTVPAGTAPSLSIIDTLPPGLQFVSSSVLTTAAGSNGLLAADFNGTVPAPVVGGGASDGDDVTFNFGPIVANADGNAANNTFLVLVTARVTDVVGNEGILPGQTSLPNTATFEIPGDGVPPTTPPSVDVQVVEPVLTIDKNFNVISADAGDTVQVSIVVGNTGTGPAHDVVLTDVVDLAKFGSITAVTTPAGFAFNNAAGTVTYSGGTIAAGGNATFVFSVKLGDGVNPSEVLSNTATATASSQPGVVPGERSFGPVTDTATLPVPAVFTLAKGITSPVGGTVQLGDVVTYQVTVTLVEGTTQNIVLTDTLPAGMTYVPGSAVVSNANGMTVNGFSASIAGQVLTLGATSVVNPGNVDNTATTDSDSFTITYQGVVEDVGGNIASTLLTNNLTGTGTGVPPTSSPPVTTTVTEPQLKVTKAVDDATPDLGQTVHFTLTIQNLAVANGADAFDILVRDAMPAGLSGIANITVSGASVDTNSSTGTLLDLKLAQLALGATATVEFDATVSSAAAFAGASIDNNARVYWDTQAAESPNAVLTGVPDGDADRDYGASGVNEIFNLDTQDAQDTERLVVNAGALTGFVYQDADASGGFNAGDNPLVGETVTLTGTTIFSESINISTTTLAGGVYSFGNLAPGTYTLTETQPVGYLDAAETAGAPFGGTVSAALGSNTITGLTIPAGNNSGSGYNFGEVLASSLSGFVYSDANNDGVVQVSETLLDGVAVSITGTDFLGQAVSISTSTAGGAYSVGNLRPGIYTITETQPVGFFDGRETVGSQGSGTVNNAVDSNTISAIALTQGVNGAGNNFGELAPASLSGIVFDDRNNDGNVDPGESGILNATVALSGTDDRGNPVSATLTTLADGTYSFGNLRPGTYTITETTPAGFLDGRDNAGSLGGSTVVNDVISGINLGAGQNGTNNRFGELTPSSLSVLVFSDLNNNGTQDPGEAGVGGVTVTLTGTDDLSNPVNIPATTAPDGTFTFGILRPGTYAITETQPGAFLDGKDAAGTLGGSIAVNDVISGIVVAPAQNGTGNRFGELVPSSLGGFAFIDSDNDGIFDLTESGQGGVTVALTGTDDLGNAVSLTTTTLGDGSYNFAGLRPSNGAGYTVTETQPPGLLDGKNAVGTAGGTTVNNPPSDVISGVVMLNANTTAAGYNFGELQPASISGTVFQDFNLDGSLNGPDSGIVNATVTLTGTDDLGGSVTLVTTTNPAGVYSFTNLRPGTYAVTETQPAGYGDGGDTVGTAGGFIAANDLIGGIVVGSGSSGTGYTFAEVFPFDPVKTIASTSNPGTSGTNLSIGEVVRYHLVVSLPDGMLPSVVLEDQLPPGLVFLDDGTAAVSLVSLSGTSVTSSTLGAPGGTNSAAAPTFLLPGSAISADIASDVDVYGSGTNVFFKLGNLTNTETNVVGGEYAVIEFNARVENIPANRLGAPLDNTFRPLFDLDSNGTPDVPPGSIVSNPATAAVAEPILFLDKQLTSGSPAPRQNDILTFTVTIGHATGSNATAWEAEFSDLLPKGLEFQSITTAATGGAVVTQAASSDANGALSGKFDIPVGGQIVITYQVKVNVPPGVGVTLVNGADVTWTSLPGNSPDERTAGDGLFGGGGLNDYEQRDDVTVKPFTFSFDSFNNFAGDRNPGVEEYLVHSPDIYRLPLLPLAPIYSGEADPGSTLVVTLYNTKGDIIGSQSVVVDAGGNWMTSFPTTVIRDYPNSVQITQSSAFYSLSDPHGHNLRTYYSPALNAGHFMFSELRMIFEGGSTPLLGDLGLRNPLSLGAVKFGGELLAAQGVPGGY